MNNVWYNATHWLLLSDSQFVYGLENKYLIKLHTWASNLNAASTCYLLHISKYEKVAQDDYNHEKRFSKV